MASDLTGRLAASLAGHDRGHTYVIVRTEGGSAWVADGRLRPLGRLKRKNLKHLLIMDRSVGAEELLTDAGIRKALKSLIKEDVNV